ncbi:MAG TPA: pseudouridine synthase [Candidatus Krumholzibacteria bacterium]|jgi:pseudouridine synthase
MAIRLNRFLAEAGLGSRRGVEALIKDGRISVNGEIVRELATVVEPDSDRIEIDGERLRARTAKRVVMFNKPAGVICSFRSQGRSPCLADVLTGPLRFGRLFHFGRLDKDTTGLLLLGDDGELAQALTHPRQPIWKEYRVRVDAPLERTQLELIRGGGLQLDGRPYAPARISSQRAPGGAAEYQISLREGRNRQIRRIFEHFGRSVRSLHRSGFGPVSLEGLETGAWRKLRHDELLALRRAAGLTSP